MARQARDIGNMPHLSEFGLFGDCQTTNMPALTGFALRLGVEFCSCQSKTSSPRGLFPQGVGE
jgi:hypothetical protein